MVSAVRVAIILSVGALLGLLLHKLELFFVWLGFGLPVLPEVGVGRLYVFAAEWDFWDVWETKLSRGALALSGLIAVAAKVYLDSHSEVWDAIPQSIIYFHGKLGEVDGDAHAGGSFWPWAVYVLGLAAIAIQAVYAAWKGTRP
jgi:hypothetical protein